MEDDQRLHTLVPEVTLYGLRFTIARSRKTAVSHPHYYHTLTTITPSLLSHHHYYHPHYYHPHCYHTLTAITPSLLSPSLLSHPHYYHPHYYHPHTLTEVMFRSIVCLLLCILSSSFLVDSIMVSVLVPLSSVCPVSVAGRRLLV